MEKIWIPEISDEKLEKLAKRIKPIVRNKNGVPYHIKKVDLRDIAYTWSPKLTKKSPAFNIISDITTHHSYGYYGFFKPSIAEVIAQIPEEYIDRVIAFEIVRCPETRNDMFGNDEGLEAVNAGYQIAITRLYEKVK
jgi:hypothetical protein